MSLEQALDRNDHAERSTSRQPRGAQRALRSPGLRKHRRTRSRRKLMAWLFMLPLVVFNVVVILGPSLATAYYAFTDWTGQGPANWVGLANFQQLFVDNDFHQALLHNIIWMALFLTIPMAVGLCQCRYLAESLKSLGWYQHRVRSDWYPLAGQCVLFRQ